jgi:hypothetical protein
MPIEDLETQLCTLAGQIAAGTCRFLVLLAAFDARQGWAGVNVRSCAHWLSWRCGLDLTTAREHVRVARALAGLPLLRETFAAGRLSYSKVRAITRVATAVNEADLVEAGLHASAADLDRLVRGLALAQAQAAETGEGDPTGGGRGGQQHFLRWRWEEDGSLVLWGRLEADDGAAVLAGLQATAAALADTDPPAEDAPAGASPDPADTPAGASPAASSAPAGASPVPGAELAASALRRDLLLHGTDPHLLAEACRAAVAGLPKLVGPFGPAPGGEVVVHVDADLLARLRAATGRAGEQARLDDGPALTLATIERLACDGGIRLQVHGSDGRTLDLGRRRRTPSAALLAALWRRDRCCRVPGCGRTRFLHAHHIRHWAHGGATSLANLILLCSAHHRALHDDHLAITIIDEQQYRFARRDRTGRLHPIPAAPPTRGDLTGLQQATGHVGTDPLTPTWDGSTHLDLDWAVMTYLANWSSQN